VKDELVKQEEI